MKTICTITKLNELDIRGAQACFKGFSVDAGSLWEIRESKSTSTTAEIRAPSPGCFIPPKTNTCVLLPHLLCLEFPPTLLLLPAATGTTDSPKFLFKDKGNCGWKRQFMQEHPLPRSLSTATGSCSSTLFSPIISSEVGHFHPHRSWQLQNVTGR